MNLSIGLMNLACGAGYAQSSSSATVVIGGDTDRYDFNIVVLAGLGVLEGSLTEDTTVGIAAGVLVVVPGPSPVESCLGLQHVTVSAVVVGVIPPTS
ncbi:MAG TPA: hypothetical protein VGQ42_14280 [Candidatus Dormibacteraeota bacterium]|nr:hypothetical protein [Candidatus Dormibacteraeota bacterium]